jgi:hypothetical protein
MTFSQIDNYSAFFGSALNNYWRDTFCYLFENCRGDGFLSAKSNDFCLVTFFFDPLGKTAECFE